MGTITETGAAIAKFTDKYARMGISAFIISTLLLIVCVLITSFKYDASGMQFAVPQQLSFAFILAYLILFVGSWFVLYILQMKSGVDVYDDVRRNLTGDWNVNYAPRVGPRSKSTIIGSRNVPCNIAMGGDKKLTMNFKIKGHPFFADDQSQTIRDVAVRYNDDGGFTMMYYYKSDRELKEEASRFLKADTGAHLSVIDIEVFGRLTFSKNAGQERVTVISGNWYDLNGNMSRLYALQDLLLSSGDIEKFGPIALSQIPIHQENFDADMGTVNYSR